MSSFLSGADTFFLRLLENDLHIPEAAELFTGSLSTNSKRGALCIFESFTVHKRVEGAPGSGIPFAISLRFYAIRQLDSDSLEDQFCKREI